MCVHINKRTAENRVKGKPIINSWKKKKCKRKKGKREKRRKMKRKNEREKERERESCWML